MSISRVMYFSRSSDSCKAISELPHSSPTTQPYLDGIRRELAEFIMQFLAMRSHELVHDHEGLLAELARHDRRRRFPESGRLGRNAQTVEKLFQLTVTSGKSIIGQGRGGGGAGLALPTLRSMKPFMTSMKCSLPLNSFLLARFWSTLAIRISVRWVLGCVSDLARP
jgi:hypothetical protein